MLITVAIPAYKAKFLKEAIDSILNQEYSNFEIVIVNDASPENLDSIVQKYTDDRIRYFVNNENCGAVNVVDNWNKCLAHANGDYIICMGDDDKLLPSCLSEYISLIEKFPNKSVYHGWTEIIDENGDIVRMQEARPLVEDVYSMMWHRWKGRVQFIGDFLYDVKYLKSVGGFYKLPLAWASDDITSYIVAEKEGVANTQVPVFQYRVNSRTISNTGNPDVKLDAIEKAIQWYKKFLSIPPNTSDEIATTFWKMCISDFAFNIKWQKEFTIKCDFKANGILRIFHWLKVRKRYSITVKNIITALLKSMN